MKKNMNSKDVGFFKASHDAKLEPDGGKTLAEYNLALGRKANAPVLGGDRQAAYDSLLSSGKAAD